MALTCLASGLRLSSQAAHPNLLATSSVTWRVSPSTPQFNKHCVRSVPKLAVQFPTPAVAVVPVVLKLSVPFQLRLHGPQGQPHRGTRLRALDAPALHEALTHVHSVFCITSKDVHQKLAVSQLQFLLVPDDSGDSSTLLQRYQFSVRALPVSTITFSTGHTLKHGGCLSQSLAFQAQTCVSV